MPLNKRASHAVFETVARHIQRVSRTRLRATRLWRRRHGLDATTVVTHRALRCTVGVGVTEHAHAARRYTADCTEPTSPARQARRGAVFWSITRIKERLAGFALRTVRGAGRSSVRAAAQARTACGADLGRRIGTAHVARAVVARRRRVIVELTARAAAVASLRIAIITGLARVQHVIAAAGGAVIPIMRAIMMRAPLVVSGFRNARSCLSELLLRCDARGLSIRVRSAADQRHETDCSHDLRESQLPTQRARRIRRNSNQSAISHR
jgi:hypothetical protein